MRPRTLAIFTLAFATPASCHRFSRSAGASGEGSSTTSVYGHWVLATPPESTAFAGATRVELVLTPATFTVSADYPGRAPLEVTGRAQLAAGGLLTLVPTKSGAEAATLGLAEGRPLTRIASASGKSLVLAPAGSRVPLPSSVWRRVGTGSVSASPR